jgi:hypothetical protein
MYTVRQVLALMRAADVGNTQAAYMIQQLQERAMAGDGHAADLLEQAREMGSPTRHMTRVSGGGGLVTTERKDGAMTITINQPGGNQLLAFIVGAATIALGVILGIMIPGMIRRQAK